MTPEQEYQQAVEMVARRLFDAGPVTFGAGGAKEYIPLRWDTTSPERRAQCLAEARSLLALAHPSGQRVLAVLSQDQTWPETAYTRSLDTDTWARIQESLLADGFRRTVEETR